MTALGVLGAFRAVDGRRRRDFYPGAASLPNRRDSFSIRERSSRINLSDVSNVVSSSLALTASSVCPSRYNSAIRISCRATWASPSATCRRAIDSRSSVRLCPIVASICLPAQHSERTGGALSPVGCCLLAIVGQDLFVELQLFDQPLDKNAGGHVNHPFPSAVIGVGSSIVSNGHRALTAERD